MEYRSPTGGRQRSRWFAPISRSALFLAALILLGGCEQLRFDRPDLSLPDPEVVAEYFDGFEGVTDIEFSGNVVVLTVDQPRAQLQRGGSLWAKVGPYIYLLAPGTRDLLEAYTGIAAVRVITQTGQGEEVARAMLLRDSMTEFQWRRSISLLGAVLNEGTADPTHLTKLVSWGEQYTEYSYNPDYVPQ